MKKRRGNRSRTDDNVPQAQSPELLLGNVLHAVLRDLHRLGLRQGQGAENVQSHLYERAVALLDANWPGGAFEDAEQDAVYYEHARSILRYYVRSDAMPTGTILGTEMELVRTIKLEGRLLGLVGRVDRIERLSDGTIEVVDYKLGGSGKLPSSQVLAYDLGTFAQYILVYLQFREVSRDVAMSLLSLTTLERVTIRYHHKHIHENLAALAALARDIEAGNDEPNPNAWCPWCSYKADCPAFSDPVDVGELLAG